MKFKSLQDVISSGVFVHLILLVQGVEKSYEQGFVEDFPDCVGKFNVVGVKPNLYGDLVVLLEDDNVER